MMTTKENQKNNKLLLIDDDPNLILLVKDYLELHGYQVTTVDNGKEALEILEQEIPDMIICDIMMPEMDGYELVKQIREERRTSGIPVMFLSAKSQTQDKVKGLNTGAIVYMVKPFEPEELAAQVTTILKFRPPVKSSNCIIKLPDNNPHLSPRELNVVALIAQGIDNRDIAHKLNISKRTVESHVSNILSKTGLNNRTQLALWVFSMENNIA